MDTHCILVYEFDGFRLDVARQSLFAPDGHAVALTSRAFEVLRYLVERSGDLVEKPVLMKAVWPTSFVEDNNLSQCVMVIRRALGDDAGVRRYILTVPGRGFKFVAPVRIRPTTAASSDVSAAPVERDPQDWFSTPLRRRAVVIATAGVWAAFATLNYWRATPATLQRDYVQLTDVPDSATAPVLSPDGKLLAFIRGGDPFLSSGQIWLKQLPDGEPLQLTHADGLIFAPAFSPDGTRVAYSLVPHAKPDARWETWTVPAAGGAATLLLPNASGLSFIGPHEVLYSEFKSGIHLGIVTSMDDRSRRREIYLPIHERGMAHYSSLSPDRKWVLVVEMGPDGQWQRCRLVPFSASTSGVAIGPTGACFSAAWSPDGRWMYLAITAGGHSHLWSQKFPDGMPTQITFGSNDDDTVAVAPDGHSLLTPISHFNSRLWLHDADGDHPVTEEGIAVQPWISSDGRRLYFMLQHTHDGSSAALWRADVTAGSKQSLLTGFAIKSFDISVDEKWVIFTTGNSTDAQIWIAPLDRHSAPRRLMRGGDEAQFDARDRVFFRKLTQHVNYLHRMNVDGGDEVRVLQRPILEFHAVSPDGRRVTVDLPDAGSMAGGYLVPVDGGPPQLLAKNWYPSKWSRDGRSLFIEDGDPGDVNHAGRTLALRLGTDGQLQSPQQPLATTAAIIPHPQDGLSISADPVVYAYVKVESHSNIFRIPLH